jgi:hypothetical protein
VDAVIPGVLGLIRKQFEIPRIVVRHVFVFVMDDFLGTEIPPELGFHA